MTRFLSLVTGVLLAPLCSVAATLQNDYPIRPVDFTRVQIQDAFWAPRLETNRTVTIPFAMKMNEETGRVDNFRKAAGMMKGLHQGKRYNDSDVFKVMEGASYSLLLHPDPELQKKLSDLIHIIAAAQEPDGYLYTARTIDPQNPAPGAGPTRWSLLRVSHELYNVGHMYEAAVAYYQATGEKDFLNVAFKNADLLVNTFGPDKIHAFPGHQEIEIGLAKLYRVSGDRRYLDLAKFFLDQRGQGLPLHSFPLDSPFLVYNDREYLQDHKPVLRQTEAVGHAVRAVYMYSGMADVAALGGYTEYANAIDTLWANVVGEKMYLTGGIGSREETEGFGGDDELPNVGYAETCAAIGNAFWNYRLFLMHGNSKYIDVLERILYNGMLSGVSLGGDRFFYQNPLESKGTYGRSPWFEVACCPGNITRFLPSLPGYIYAVKDDNLYVNLFIAGTAQIDIMDRKVSFRQETNYPWSGHVKMVVTPDNEAQFTVCVRIPGWAQNQPVPSDLYRYLDPTGDKVTVNVNRKPIVVQTDKGYLPIKRLWHKGDIIEMDLPMPIHRVVSNDLVKADVGRVALERGPIVYCAEGIDNGGRVLDLILPDSSTLMSEYKPDLLNGITVIHGDAQRLITAHSQKPPASQSTSFMAIPYYAWDHRGDGEMAVWLQRAESNKVVQK